MTESYPFAQIETGSAHMKYTKAFDKVEYETRLNRVKQSMQSSGFDLLVCQDPASMSWLTGFDGWSFYTPQAVLVHLEESSPIWFGRAQDAKSARITTDLPDENIIGFTEGLVQHHPGARYTGLPVRQRARRPTSRRRRCGAGGRPARGHPPSA